MKCYCKKKKKMKSRITSFQTIKACQEDILKKKKNQNYNVLFKNKLKNIKSIIRDMKEHYNSEFKNSKI